LCGVHAPPFAPPGSEIGSSMMTSLGVTPLSIAAV
jgi:hypothetical protein